MTGLGLLQGGEWWVRPLVGCQRAAKQARTFFFFFIPSPEPPRAATISSTHSQKEMDYNRLFSFKQGPGALQPLHPLDVCTDGFEASTEDLSFCLHEIWFDWRTKPSSGRFWVIGVVGYLLSKMLLLSPDRSQYVVSPGAESFCHANKQSSQKCCQVAEK